MSDHFKSFDCRRFAPARDRNARINPTYIFAIYVRCASLRRSLPPPSLPLREKYRPLLAGTKAPTRRDNSIPANHEQVPLIDYRRPKIRARKYASARRVSFSSDTRRRRSASSVPSLGIRYREYAHVFLSLSLFPSSSSFSSSASLECRTRNYIGSLMADCEKKNAKIFNRTTWERLAYR